jgi:aminopeptidase N
MEYPALTMISDSLDEASALYTVVHENAHQWWYAMVGSDQVNYSWQDEGLAEYSSLLFFENTPNYGITRTGMLGSATKSYRAFYSVYNQIFGDADTTMNRPLNKFISEYEYVNIAYNKGLLMFEAVRTAMGDEKFFAGLRDYFSTCLYQIATPEHLIAAFVKKADVEGVFSSFLDGKIII